MILVTVPEPTALAASYALLKLCHQLGFCGPVGVVINMVRQRGAAIASAHRLQHVARQFLGLSVENVGQIPFDRHVVAAVGQRTPFVQRYPRCAASTAVDGIARRLIRPAGRRRAQFGLWGRVASLFL